MNNTGFSLVELLVAMAVAAIVSGCIGYFLVTSVHMYGSEINDLTMQQEVSTAFNIIEDYIKEAQFVAIGNYKDDDANGHAMTLNANKTKYLVVGTFIKQYHPINKNFVSYQFEGALIVADSNVLTSEYADGDKLANGRLYLRKIPREVIDDTSTNGQKYNMSKPGKIQALVKEILNASEEDKKKYLLATNVQNFSVTVEDMAPLGEMGIMPGKCTLDDALKNGYKAWIDITGGTGDDEVQYYYDDNISLNVHITVANQLSGRVEKKSITESVMIRNAMYEDILINNPIVSNTDPSKVKKFKKYNNMKYQ